MKNNKLFLVLILILLFFIFNPWLDFTKTLSSGDWPYLFLENIQAFKIPTESPFLWLEPYYQITAKLGVQIFSLSWEATEKIFWFFPFLIISLASSYFFLKYLFRQLKINSKKSNIFIALGCLIFTTNTYILMLVGGGQMGVVMAYSLVPAVLQRTFTAINSPNFNKKNFILSSLILAIQLMFDPRIFLLSIFIAFLYVLFAFRNFNVKIFKRIIAALILTVIANLFWILPNISYLNAEYRSAADAASANFLSFATFSNSMSLLHPNWPENIFGKIGFMKSEFIILPILAFLALVLARKNKTILFFSFIGIVGAFFAKGTNPPFEGLYGWLSNFPGFSIFRDPTKFYVLIVISYIVLIPYSLYKLTEKLSSIKCYVLFFGFLVFWSVLISPALLGHLTGTFKPHVIPQEYVYLKDFLIKQPAEFTRTLWVPSVERFGYNSRVKPAISFIDIFGISLVSEILSKFDEPEVKNQLANEEVKYLIVPYDYLKEIFLTDRRFDNSLYIRLVDELRSVNWLYEIKDNNFGKIKVFKVVY